MKILWIAFVWPEPESSAAGLRTLEMLRACRDAGHEVLVSSACADNSYRRRLEDEGLRTARFEPNDSEFDEFVRAFFPHIAVFDRFMVEEQFGWRIRAACPDAARVLDTVDVHSLRRGRERAVARGDDPMVLPAREFHAPDALRELASIHRCDLSLIVSDAERAMLCERCGVAPDVLDICSLFYPPAPASEDFESRRNFIFIGNFNHPPNADAVRLLQHSVWGTIREKLRERDVQDAELHVYGAYPTREFMRLDDETSGFRVKGSTADSLETLRRYRVNLAPLRFGAGLKGKVSDGWFAGTPCAATPIAAEGMGEPLEFGGAIDADWTAFSESAVGLYTDSESWRLASARGVAAVRKRYDRSLNGRLLVSALETVHRELVERRERNVIGSMLWREEARSTEYFSRWIEAKNRASSDRERRAR